MDKIKATLLEIKECTDKYGINRYLGDNNNIVLPRRPVRKFILPNEDDPDIIGLQKDKEKIVNLLLDPNNNRRRVVSIVGQEGLGKTTLAKKVYNSDEVKKFFQYRIWLSVSQQYRLQDLLKTMLERIRPLKEDEEALIQNDEQYSRGTVEKFLTELKVFLTKTRYLVILDDVWTSDLWIQIEDALPDVKNSSRVLVTTRFSDIARKADPSCDTYNLSYLSEKESQQLLIKKAFLDQDFKTFSQDLSDLLKKFVERCGGLPLALLAVGGILSRQPPTYISRRKVLERLSWHDGEGKECTDILATSYEDLPHLLKPCFMYFGLFPEDHEIKAKPLIRMWVAEGFIPREDSRKTMEETAEDYLEELIKRSMISVSRRYHNGSVMYCHIHDLMRDLAIYKGRENRFLEIISSQDRNYSSSTVTVRRAALHSDDIIETTDPKLRSLLLFGTKLQNQNVERFKLLKILHGNYDGYDWIKGGSFRKLVQLRYIALTCRLNFHRYCESLWWPERQFWRSIRCMRDLQTLEIPKLNRLSHNGCSRLFDCIWDIKTLRHVILPSWYYGPPSTAQLPNLQTLKLVRVRKEWLSKGWPTMPSIQVLKLYDFPPNYGESFQTFLCGLHHLTSLRVMHFFSTWECKIWDMSVFPWYNQLQSLVVFGKWTNTKVQNDLVPHTITTSSFPKHLIKLNLVYSGIQEDPMPILEKLESLQVLYLSRSAYEGRQLNCSARGFPRLQFLTLERLENLEEWKADVAEGAMPMLKEIDIERCRQLHLIPGLQHMTSLSKFTLHWGSDHLLRSLREDESHKIRDGHFVHFNFIKDRGWAYW